MKILTACVAAVLGLAASAGVHAATPAAALVTADYTYTVAPAEMKSFAAGVKDHFQCLHQHGLKFNIYAFTHATGRYVFKISYDVGPITWAQLDELNAAIKPCKANLMTQIIPHVKGLSSAFMVEQPDLSHMPAGSMNQVPPNIFRVLNYTLKPGRRAGMAFSDAVKKIAAAAAKTQWPYYWDTVTIEGGGEGAPDYQLVIGSKDWAAVGAEPNPALWKMVASVYGQADADSIRESLDGAIKSLSDHFDRYNADLSYLAGK